MELPQAVTPAPSTQPRYRINLDRDHRRDDPLVQEQIALEVRMREEGIIRYRESVRRSLAREAGGETPGGLSLVHLVILEFAEAIHGAHKTHAERAPVVGRFPNGLRGLLRVPADVAAFTALRVILNSVVGEEYASPKRKIQSLAVKIGDELDYEAYLSVIRKEAPPEIQGRFKAAGRALKNRGTGKKRMKKTQRKNGREMGLTPEQFDELTQAQMGLWLIHTLAELPHSPIQISKIRTQVTSQKTNLMVSLNDTAKEILADKHARGELLRPVYFPMIVPPKDWDRHPEYDRKTNQKTGGEVNRMVGGGYLSSAAKRLSLVKSKDYAYLEELKHIDLTAVRAALNAIQRTPWRVNQKVLSVLEECWVSGRRIAGLPVRMTPEEQHVPKPPEADTDPEVRKVWRRQIHLAETERCRLESLSLTVDRVLGVAKEFQAYQRIYFPHQLDFRGRIYAVPPGLNPQGDDSSKGLLEFGTAVPIGDGWRWLAIHGANVYGNDKVAFEARVQWVIDNQAEILKCAENPLEHQWWAGADKPWQFLAFCFEWHGYKQCGSAWETRLPVAVDGTCNGLQHFSAMLRDPVGAAAVNLAPDTKPHDIYAEVAAHVVDGLTGRKVYWAKQWLEFGVNRKTVKRCCMTLPYGATMYSFKAFVMNHILERKIAGEAHPFPDDKKHVVAGHLAEKIHDALKDTVGAAVSAMAYLKDVAKFVGQNHQVPLRWSVPSGWVVQQRYRKVRVLRVGEENSRGHRPEVYLTSPDIDTKKQAQAVAPNFVHSHDASALVLTVCKAIPAGLTHFAMIHDSYGTHAPQVPTLNRVLREAFVENYQGGDVLAEWRKDVCAGLCDPESVPVEPPAMGTFDIKQVLTSEYFFA